MQIAKERQAIGICLRATNENLAVGNKYGCTLGCAALVPARAIGQDRLIVSTGTCRDEYQYDDPQSSSE